MKVYFTPKRVELASGVPSRVDSTCNHADNRKYLVGISGLHHSMAMRHCGSRLEVPGSRLLLL